MTFASPHARYKAVDFSRLRRKTSKKRERERKRGKKYPAIPLKKKEIRPTRLPCQARQGSVVCICGMKIQIKEAALHISKWKMPPNAQITPIMRVLLTTPNPIILQPLPWYIITLKKVVEYTATCCHEDAKPPPLICPYSTRSPLEEHLVIHGQLASLSLGSGGLGHERVKGGGG